MANKSLPSISDLRKFMRYNPETGQIFWKPRSPDDFVNGKRLQSDSCRTWNSKFADKPALTTIDAHGYFGGRFQYRAIKAHRAAYAIYHGCWPKGDVDHINGIRTDNRIENLRDCTRAQNLANSKSSSGASKYRGVSKSGKRWAAWCSHNNKSVFGGRHDTEVEAAKAYDKLAVQLRGEYASLNFPE